MGDKKKPQKAKADASPERKRSRTRGNRGMCAWHSRTPALRALGVALAGRPTDVNPKPGLKLLDSSTKTRAANPVPARPVVDEEVT